MAFSSTEDNRTHVLGDLMMVTGDWNAASVATGELRQIRLNNRATTLGNSRRWNIATSFRNYLFVVTGT